jgi:hypothetical protein
MPEEAARALSGVSSPVPFRFYRRKTIVPGVRLNLSRSGPSLSFGVRGAHYTVGPGRRRATVGIPGSGMFYTQYSHQHARSSGRRWAASLRAGTPSSSAGVVELFHKPPGAKIGYGILFTVLVLTAPIGLPLLATGIVQLFASRTWRTRRLLAKAHANASPEESKRLLDAAAAVLPADPEVLASQAAWNVGQLHWDAAVDLYARYLAQVPADPVARGQYARALLMDTRVDEAIAQFLQVRALLLDDESEASITSLLTMAWLMKGDAHQALAIVKEAPLQRRTLGEGLKQCLRYRAIAQYMVGNTARAVADMERLYAVNPAYPEVTADKAAMQAGTFSLATPVGELTRATSARPRVSPAE